MFQQAGSSFWSSKGKLRWLRNKKCLAPQRDRNYNRSNQLLRGLSPLIMLRKVSKRQTSLKELHICILERKIENEVLRRTLERQCHTFFTK